MVLLKGGGVVGRERVPDYKRFLIHVMGMQFCV